MFRHGNWFISLMSVTFTLVIDLGMCNFGVQKKKKKIGGGSAI